MAARLPAFIFGSDVSGHVLQVRARRAAPHPAVDAVPRVWAALATVEAEAIHISEDIEQVRLYYCFWIHWSILLVLIQKQHDDPSGVLALPGTELRPTLSAKHPVRLSCQVTAIQRERAALWRCLHGGLGPAGGVRPDAIDSELLVYVWMRLRRTLARLPNCAVEAGLTAAGGAHPLLAQILLSGAISAVKLLLSADPQSCSACAAVGQGWQHAALGMNQALGLDTLPAGKPLLWRGAGHPRLPRTLQLCHLLRELQALCGISR